MLLQYLTQEEIEHLESLDFYEYTLNGIKPFKVKALVKTNRLACCMRGFHFEYSLKGVEVDSVHRTLSRTPYDYTNNSGRHTPVDIVEYFLNRRKTKKFDGLKQGDVVFTCRDSAYNFEHLSQLKPVIFCKFSTYNDIITRQYDAYTAVTKHLTERASDIYVRSDFDENGFLIKNK